MKILAGKVAVDEGGDDIANLKATIAQKESLIVLLEEMLHQANNRVEKKETERAQAILEFRDICFNSSAIVVSMEWLLCISFVSIDLEIIIVNDQII